MPKLPSVADNHVILQTNTDAISPQVAAAPYNQIAEALGAVAQDMKPSELDTAEKQGQNASYRDANGNLQVTMKPNNTAMARTYNHAAAIGYTARAAGDIRANLQKLSDQANGNVGNFDAGFQTYSKQVMSTVPEAAQGQIQTMLDQEASRSRLGVIETQRRRDIDTFATDSKMEGQRLMDETATLARAGGTDTPDYHEKMGQLHSLYGQMVANPDFNMSQKQADIDLSHAESRNMSEAMVGNVTKTLQTDGVVAARKLADSILTDTKLELSPAERRQYNGIMDEAINGYVAQQKVALKPLQDQSEQVQKLLDKQVGIDNPQIDDMIGNLARGGDVAGALKLSQARNSARVIQQFKLASPTQRLQIAQNAFSAANGNVPASMMQVESGGDPNAVSPKGALGSMQILPSTAEDIARDMHDANFPKNGTAAEKQAYLQQADVNEKYGQFYYNQQLQRYGGDQQAALIAYNGGQKRADDWLAAGRDDSVIPKESADYYKKVLAGAGAAPSTPGRKMAEAGPSAARAFLTSVSSHGAESVDGLEEGFGNKLAALIQAAPPEIRNGLGLFSGYRSPEHQSELWQAALKKYGSAEEARKWVAPPGNSEHNRGNAADIGYNGQSLKNAPPAVVAWLHENAGTYGLKFPLANENWHIEDAGTRGGGAPASTPRGGLDGITPEMVDAYREGVTADARHYWSDMQEGVKRGYPPDPSEFALFAKQLAVVNDPNLTADVSRFMSTEAAGQAIAGLPAEQRAAAISSLQAGAHDGATVAQQDLLEAAQRTRQQMSDALKTDPIGYASQRGIAQPVPALDTGAGADAIGASLAARQNTVNLLRARGEVGNISALRPEDTTALGNFIQTASPSDQAALLGTMAKSLSVDTYKATLADLAAKPDTKALATAGALYRENPDVAQGIIRGRALLRENANFAPKKDDYNQQQVDAILPPTAFGSGLEVSRQQLLDAATARYADLSNTAGDTSGQLNSDRMNQAVEEVTGGVLDMNGDKVVAPQYGMKQSDFDDMIKNLPADKLKGAVMADGTPITPRDLYSQGRLKAIGDGQYLLAFGVPGLTPGFAQQAPITGDSLTSKVQGGPFILDLRKK